MMPLSAKQQARHDRTEAIFDDFKRRCEAQAAIARSLKHRARDYLARPARLEILYPGLGCAEPRRMIAIGEALLRQERDARLQIVPVKAINAKAVILLGRYQRRKAYVLAKILGDALKTTVPLEEREAV